MNEKEIRKNLLSLDTDSLLIKFTFETETVDIAEVKWDPNRKSCYIKTIDENFQDYITDWERFKDFIYLIDEAYYIGTKKYYEGINENNN